MKIGIDATSLCRKITGIEVYALDLVKNILKIDKRNNYIIFFRQEVHPELVEFKDKVKFLICPINNQIFCEQIWLPYIAIKEKVDLIHFPAFPPGLFTFKKHIVTIHDASIWEHWRWLSWKGKIYMTPLIKLSSKRALHILTVSEYAKKELMEVAKIKRGRITNTGNSIHERFKMIEDKAILKKVKQKFNLPEKFILSVSLLAPSKNFERLLEAYILFKQNQTNSPYKLVITGRKAWGASQIENKIHNLGLKEEIILTGYVSIDELVALYNLANVFVHLSLYEGFGRPPLEAMACGTPVITSNATSLPEVVGEAAILVNPYNVKEIAKAIMEVVSNLQLREELRKKGLRQVKKFDWEKIARKTIKVYNSVEK